MEARLGRSHGLFITAAAAYVDICGSGGAAVACSLIDGNSKCPVSLGEHRNVGASR